MQTFLPYPDFRRSAEVLDPKRLGKQRVEVIQIVRALTVPSYAWKNHPAVLMWAGHGEALGRYGIEVVRRWRELGHEDTCEQTIRDDLATAGVTDFRTQAELARDGALPRWLGDEGFHRSHRSNLLRKDPEWYSRFFDDVPDDLAYVWPVRSERVLEAERRRAQREAARAAAAASTGADADAAVGGRGPARREPDRST